MNFLKNTCASMRTYRRSTATAQDFASALASTANTSSASLLQPQLSVSVPEGVSNPPIEDPHPSDAPMLDFSDLLAPLMDPVPPKYIPSHFPKLPPKHSWKHTDDYPDREQDARQMREKATEEGIMAEQALRKLAAAAKVGAARGEKRRLEARPQLPAKVHKQERGRRKRVDSGQGEEMFGDMMREAVGGIDGDEGQVIDLGMDGVSDLRGKGVDVGMPEGVLVNSEMGSWRSGGRKGIQV
jgi:transcription initiation factor TFIID subunit 8